MGERTRIDRGDPWNNCYFSLEIDGAEIAHFLECTGFKSTAEQFEIEEGGLNSSVHYRSGASSWGTITLKKAITSTTEFLEWRDAFLTEEGFGTRPTKIGAIVIRAEDGSELRRYSMVGIWPVSWEAGTYSSGASDLAVETLEIAFDRLQLGGVTNPPEPPQPDPPGPGPEKKVPPDDVPPDDVPPDDVPPDEKKEEKKEPPPSISLDSSVLFRLGSSDITPTAAQIAEAAAQDMKDSGWEEWYIEGHTCDSGSPGFDNAKLSQDRANSLKQELIGNGVKASSIKSAIGYGFKYPKADNNSESNRKQNRRGDIHPSPRSGLRPGEKAYKKF